MMPRHPVPTEKQISPNLAVKANEYGYPYWTRLLFGEPGRLQIISLSHEEARDLHYAMSRIVAYLDAVEKE